MYYYIDVVCMEISIVIKFIDINSVHSGLGKKDPNAVKSKKIKQIVAV